MQTLGVPTVRDIAAGSLAAVGRFEKFGIDYCCGGKPRSRTFVKRRATTPLSLSAYLTPRWRSREQLYAVELSPSIGMIQHIAATHHIPVVRTHLVTESI